MAVDFERAEYQAYKDTWKLIDDIIDSRNVREYIIPPVEPMEGYPLTPEESARNRQFKRRAVFAAVAAYTVRGFIGLVYGKKPIVKLPSGLEYLERNCDGLGVGIVQKSKEATTENITLGRFGLWADYPETERPSSLADMEERGLYSTIQLFYASQIINWATKQRGASVVLSFVNLRTTRETVEDFEIKHEPIIMQLYLDAGAEGGDVYRIQMWKEAKSAERGAKTEWVKDGPAKTPIDARGRPFDTIPFVFGGSEANTWRVDKPPMQDLCALNVAHLNNSATYEDAVAICGQPQPWMSGISKEDIADMKEARVRLGSRVMLGVPSNERFEIASAGENTMVKQAMDDKITLMVGLGAMVLQPGGAVKTATQSEGEQRAQHSVLSLSAANVAEAFRSILVFVAKFMGVEGDLDEAFELNQDYVDPNADFNMLREMIAGFISGAIPPADYHRWMKRNNFANENETLEEFMEQITAVVGSEPGMGMEEPITDGDAL